ncbi:AbiH family protein [Lacticaseibacillus songhuajiangensis]|uniref:AbiH family protein n=1 Tax=Lacticaseibacillus songhuajiangensis TaxID=1296539 RepID=UPI000F76F050|nr:AbiH family protein [Lacticaseibacillus songhuajiangensis]
MNLVIIGNGFDLHFGLKTGIKDFQNVLAKLDSDSVFESSLQWWSGYEEDLGNMDFEDLETNEIIPPDYMSDHESDRDSGIAAMDERMSQLMNTRQEALAQMANQANVQLEKKSNRYAFDSDCAIVSFNYTSTLEVLFQYDSHINGILHIHGFAEDDDPSALLFGYSEPNRDILRKFSRIGLATGDEALDSQSRREYDEARKHGDEDVPDYYITQQEERILAFYKKNQKKLELKSLDKYLSDKVGQIDEIIVVGHSLGIVDRPYFNFIDNKLNQPMWTIFSFHKQLGDSDIAQLPFKNRVRWFTEMDLVIHQM